MAQILPSNGDALDTVSPMEKIVCDITALRYYRTPPRLFHALPTICDFETPYGRTLLRDDPVATQLFDIPIHALSLNNDRLTSTLVFQHFRTGQLPDGSIVDTQFDFSVTSPLLTLLMLGYHLDPIELAMLIYEFTGSFALFSPTKIIAPMVDDERLSDLDDWIRVGAASMKPGDLWSRPALLKLSAIEELIESSPGMRGIRKLRRAMRYVTGSVASPFEAKASMLLGAPRTMGGAGLGGFTNNCRIDLDERAQATCGKSHLFGDIVWPENEVRGAVVLECQGAVAHGSCAAAQADDDRALALEQMGYKVVRITYKQISDERRFKQLAEHLAGILGIAIRPAAPRTKERAVHMHKMLFKPWPYSSNST